MERSRVLRASDADRQSAADGLRVALDDGQVGFAVFDEWLVLVCAARAYGELDRPVADLWRVRSALAPA